MGKEHNPDGKPEDNSRFDEYGRWKPGEFEAVIESRKLVTPKSNLEWAHRGEGLARIDPLITTPELKYVDYIQNYYADGFTPNRLYSKITEFKGVGENTQKFDPLYRTTTANPSVDFEATKRFENYPKKVLDDLPSPLEILHTKGLTDRSPLRKDAEPGYSYTPLPLESMYAKGLKVGDRLSYKRGNEVLGFDQPFIIRDIGNQWGIDKVPLMEGIKDVTLKKILTIGINAIDEVGGVVLGRQPSAFIDRYLADITRNLKFLATPKGAGFLLKQKVLHRRNAFDKTGGLKYKLIGVPTSLGDALSLGRNMIDPKSYSVLSLGSIPGAFNLPRYGLYNPGNIIEDAKEGVAKFLSREALELVKPVGEAIIDFTMNAIGVLGDTLYDLAPAPIQGGLDKLSQGIERTKNQAEAWQKVASKAYGEVSKAVTAELGMNKEFADVGADKVNLIRYGETAHRPSGMNYDKLDWIPFKFHDVNNDKPIVFRAILSGISDTFTPNYSEEKYIGRPDKVYVYQGTDRTISFTFDIYPKSDKELVTLWEKMNYLAGLTYPEWAPSSGGMGSGMIAPFCKLTIGQMFTDTPGYISALTYTVQDNGTWETTFAKLPKYIQASCTFVYIGKRLPSTIQKHYELPWVGGTKYQIGTNSNIFMAMMDNVDIDMGTLLKQSPDSLDKWAANK